MGAWGVNTFDNDCALDWLSELEDEKDLSIIVDKFFEFKDDYNNGKEGSADSDLSSEVLAAAEVVAALLGSPGSVLPKSIAKWLEKKKNYDRSLISYYNHIFNSDELDDDELKREWKSLSKENKWRDILEGLSSQAQEVIEIVLDNSELKELWESSENYVEWIEVVKELKQRCILNSK